MSKLAITTKLSDPRPVKVVVLCASEIVTDSLERAFLRLGCVVVNTGSELSLLKHVDLVACWGYPHKVPAEVLTLPRLGCVNMHPSLLPRHRGRIPLAWALRENDRVWGVTWHRMDESFDTGPVLAQDCVWIEDDDVDVHEIEAKVGGHALALLPDVLERVIDRDPGDPQQGTPSYAPRFSNDDYARVDWRSTARYVHNQARAWSMNRYPFDAPVAHVEGYGEVVVRRTSLTETDGVRVECWDAPIWVVR